MQGSVEVGMCDTQLKGEKNDTCPKTSQASFSATDSGPMARASVVRQNGEFLSSLCKCRRAGGRSRVGQKSRKDITASCSLSIERTSVPQAQTESPPRTDPFPPADTKVWSIPLSNCFVSTPLV